jgi:hypothetical protein
LVIDTELADISAYATATQGYLVYVATTDANDPNASAEIISYSNGSVKIQVALDTGWNIRGYFVVS